MSKSAFSVRVFALYALVVGTFLVLVPKRTGPGKFPPANSMPANYHPEDQTVYNL